MKTRPGPKRYGSPRVESIDAARGAAMLFVCLAHFTNAYHFMSGADDAGTYLVIVGMLASPTFVTMSGLVAGFLAVTRANSFTALRYKLVDRGIFLLLVGHSILAFSGILAGRGVADSFRVGYITDAIGLAVILGPWLVVSLRARYRLLLAACVFASSWCLIVLWVPREGILALAKHYLIGVTDPTDWTRGDFPLVPWFAIYLAGTVIGERLGDYYRANREKAGHLFLAKVGAISLGVGATGKIVLIFARVSIPLFAEKYPALASLLSSYQKFPPGPVYAAFFGGAGMVLVAGILEAGRRGVQPFLLNQLRQIGLASLFIYIAQFYLYVVVLRALRLPYSPFWPLLFLTSVAILSVAAALWNAREGNRYLTVGIGSLLDRRARKRGELSNRPSPQEASALSDGALAGKQIASGRLA